jgi:hypothetical protein
VQNDSPLPRIPECYRKFQKTGRGKKDNRHHENSETGTGRLEHLYEAVTVGNVSVVLAASIFHFGEISISEAKQYLKEKGIPVKI